MKEGAVRRLTRPVAVLAGLATMVATGAALVAPGAASATTPLTATMAPAPGASITTLSQGGSAEPAGSMALTFSNTFSQGDKIVIDVETGSTPTANTGTVAQAVYFTTTPTVSSPAGASGNSSSDSPPDLTTTHPKLGTNVNDSAAVRSAALTDELVLTFGNNSTGVQSDTFTITLSAIQYTVGSAAGGTAPSTPAELFAVYQTSPVAQNFNTSPSAPNGAAVQNGTITTYTLTDAPFGAAEGSTATPVGAFAVTELTPGVLAAGKYTLSPKATASGGPSSPGAFSGTATVTATGATLSVVPGSGTCPTSGGVATATVAANSSGQIQFCVVTASTASTGNGSLTISGLTYNAPSSAGTVSVVLANQSGSITLTSTQPGITVVYNPRVAGQTADDTAAAAGEYLYGGGQMNKGQGGAVILASDAEYQDALAASFLGNSALPYQTINGSGASSSTATMASPVPILLNPPTQPASGESSTAAGQAIAHLRASTVYIIGGTLAISSTVATQLQQITISSSGSSPQHLQVVRIAGQTAEQTAAQVAVYPKLAGNQATLPATPAAYGSFNSGAGESPSGPASGTVPTAILADADEFQDALAVSPLAYSDTLPVLLNAGGQDLDPSASQAISGLGIKQVIIVGGSAAVTNGVSDQLQQQGVSVLRIAGQTFDTTAELLAVFELNEYTAPSASQSQLRIGLGSPATEGAGPGLTLGTSRGDAFQDALSSAQLLGESPGDVSPLLLTGGVDTLPAGAAAVLKAYGSGPTGGLALFPDTSGNYTIEHVLGDIVFGGTLAQSADLVGQELDDIAVG